MFGFKLTSSVRAKYSGQRFSLLERQYITHWFSSFASFCARCAWIAHDAPGFSCALMYQQEVLGLQGVPAGCAAPSAPAMQAIKEAWGRLQLGEQTPRLASTNGTPSTTGSSSTWAMTARQHDAPGFFCARCATVVKEEEIEEDDPVLKSRTPREQIRHHEVLLALSVSDGREVSDIELI